MENTSGESLRQPVQFKRVEIFNLLKGSLNIDTNEQIEIIKVHFNGKNNDSFVIDEKGVNELKDLIHKMKRRWQSAHRTIKLFFLQNENWLNEEISIACTQREMPTSSKFGRPSTSF